MIEKNNLPLDSFKILGESYVDEIIPGFRSVKATGRESLAKELSLYDDTTADGSRFKRSRYTTRTIDVSFVIKRNSTAEMHESCAQLTKYLNRNEVHFSFNGESEFFYIGTPALNVNGEIKNGCTGVITFACYDPFKYSVDLTEVQQSNDVPIVTVDESGTEHLTTGKGFIVNNTGGYKAYPVFDVTFPNATPKATGGSDADCGYVMFIKGNSPDEKEYSIQCGDDEEQNTSTVNALNTDFTDNQTGWAFNSTMNIPASLNLAVQGSVKRDGKGQQANSYGTSVSKKYYGPLSVYTLSNTLDGDFKISLKHVLALSSTEATAKKECGAYMIGLFDASKNLVAGLIYKKSNKTKLDASAYMFTALPDSTIFADEISIKYTGKLGYKNKSDTVGRLSETTIERVGNDLSFNDPAGVSPSAVMDIVPIKYIGIFYGGYGGSKFTSNRTTSIKVINGSFDADNTFGANDELTIDVGSAEIVLNNENTPSLGDVGNNWEDMALDVGENTIIFQYSDWVVNNPTAVMKYRKRWL